MNSTFNDMFSGTQPNPIVPGTEGGFDDQSREVLAENLRDSLGQRVICEFLIGNSQLVEKSGVLYYVGVNFIALFDESSGTYILCDLYSLKFVNFLDPEADRGAITQR